jgi:hypothetical protein
MTKFLTALVLAILSQQTLAVTTEVVGIEFLDIANTVSDPVGTFKTNDGAQPTPVNSAVDLNAASYTYGMSDISTLDVLFSGPANAASVNLTLLFVGSNPHTGTVSLFGGTGGVSSDYEYSLTPYIPGATPAEDVFNGYTGFNSVSDPGEPTGGDAPPPSSVKPPPPPLGIFALTINLSEAFPGFTGDFTGVGLNIYDGVGGNYDSALSLVGTTAVIPVPAAVWLFGSGLLGLVGVVRRKK